MPIPPAIIKTEDVNCPDKACCPACANGKCAGCPSDSCCQVPACVAPGCTAARDHEPKRTLEGRLIRLIVSTINPESWEVNGGRGTIDFFPLGMALTVNQTPEIQEQVAQLLAALRRLQDEQIAVEVRVIRVPPGYGEEVAGMLGTCGGAVNESSSCPGCCSKDHQGSKDTAKLKFLSEALVQKFMDELQAHPKTNVMMAPKMTVLNGQTANINISELQFFVTNVKTIRQGDQTVFVPENHPFSTGLQFLVKPTLSPDHHFIQMGFEIEEKSLNMVPDQVPLFPVTTFITPIREDGMKCEPVPFTQFLQQPAFLTQRVHQEVCVPCGQSVLFNAFTRCDKVPEETGAPILSWLPYIGDMFKTVNYHEETADVWVMVTPRLIISQEEETRPPAAAAPPATVAENLEKLTHARALHEQAEHCRRQGQTESARHIYEKVQQICPGSRYAQLAARRLKQLPVRQTARAPEPVSPSPMPVFEYMKLRNSPEFKRDQEVSDYLSQYWRACAEGQMTEAVQWAVQALALDPACFTKARNTKGQKAPGQTVTPSAN